MFELVELLVSEKENELNEEEKLTLVPDVYEVLEELREDVLELLPSVLAIRNPCPRICDRGVRKTDASTIDTPSITAHCGIFAFVRFFIDFCVLQILYNIFIN